MLAWSYSTCFRWNLLHSITSIGFYIILVSNFNRTKHDDRHKSRKYETQSSRKKIFKFEPEFPDVTDPGQTIRISQSMRYYGSWEYVTSLRVFVISRLYSPWFYSPFGSTWNHRFDITKQRKIYHSRLAPSYSLDWSHEVSLKTTLPRSKKTAPYTIRLYPFDYLYVHVLTPHSANDNHFSRELPLSVFWSKSHSSCIHFALKISEDRPLFSI